MFIDRIDIQLVDRGSVRLGSYGLSVVCRQSHPLLYRSTQNIGEVLYHTKKEKTVRERGCICVNSVTSQGGRKEGLLCVDFYPLYNCKSPHICVKVNSILYVRKQ